MHSNLDGYSLFTHATHFIYSGPAIIELEVESMAEEGDNFINMLVILSLIIYLTEESRGGVGCYKYYPMELDGKVCKHSYEHYYDFNRASAIPFLHHYHLYRRVVSAIPS